VLIAQAHGQRRPRRPEAAPRCRSVIVRHSASALTAQVVSLPLIWETPTAHRQLRDRTAAGHVSRSSSFLDELAARDAIGG